uniref:Polybia-mastoparan-I n=1 Tax=Polybia paulista TaxID=291283 RepID=MASTI_POLPI|nr:RecName: Full=Polybia-mastoparan-I; Short=Polybia-MP-I; Short=Polybia-MPI; AltName: Full=Mastoparan I; AltName: Full=Mastoparan-1; Short=MP-1; Short=MP1 [Polybia paulista]
IDWKKLLDAAKQIL